MKKVLLGYLLILFAITFVAVTFAKSAGNYNMNTAKAAANTEEGLNKAMRKLWEDHVQYTREYIISALADLPDANAVATRLLRNQEDIGNAVSTYYGNDAGKQLTALLKDHIMIAVDIVKAAKAGDKNGVDSGEKRWHANGDQLAAFLSSANPNWSKKEMGNMLDKHLELTTKEVTSRLNKDWDADIKAYDDGHVHMLMFADILTTGIVKQFPDKFSTQVSSK